VQDFQSAQAASEADANWAKQFQKDEVPENVDYQEIALASVRSGSAADQSPYEPVVRVDKLILLAGLAESATDAQRKRKQKAVRILFTGKADDLVEEPALIFPANAEFVLKVGRRVKRIKLV